jgi:hypothetical protein
MYPVKWTWVKSSGSFTGSILAIKELWLLVSG